MQIKINKISYHRNGVSGDGFNVILFTWKDIDDIEEPNRNMLAILFKEHGKLAILDIDETNKGNIEFGKGNSWRGDRFESDLRDQIKRRSLGNP